MEAITEREEIISLFAGENYDPALLCSCCHSEYTHIYRVGTLMSSDEDEGESKRPYLGTVATGTTPDRRQAVEIAYWCEMCHQRSRLIIQQSKGVNFLYFDANLDESGEPPNYY